MTAGYEALASGAAWIDLSARGRVTVRGRDRARLLHSISSNDIKQLAPGSGCYAFLLSPQGRIQVDFELLCRDDDFLIDTEPDLREKVMAHILRYKVADQVELEDRTASTVALGIEGPATEGPAGEAIRAAVADGSVAPFRLTGQPGFRVYGDREAAGEWIRRLERAGVVPATAEDARRIRIENGKPRYGEDIRDTTLPQESQQMHAVSFQKGCYIGQEIVERIRAQGRVNRKLARLEIEGEAEVPAGSKVMAGEKEGGEVTSSVYSPRARRVVAMAYLRAEYFEPGTALSVLGRPARLAANLQRSAIGDQPPSSAPGRYA
ncbi:MAG: glycine cleavage T C-terminal barrel domain-containing protein [Bryobacteraceae bacterium]|jgi:folate-binding protein YgfZ